MRPRLIMPPRSFVLAAFLLASFAAVAGGRGADQPGVERVVVPAVTLSCMGGTGEVLEPGACLRQDVRL